MLAGTMFCLALNHVIGRGLHETVPPVGLSFWRWSVAACLMLPLVWRNLPVTLAIYRRSWRIFLLLGVLMVGSTTLFLVTLHFTTVINVSLVNALQPTMTVLLSWLLFRQRLIGLQVLGILLGLAGVVVMISQGSWQVFSTLAFNTADVVALLGVLGLAVYAICLRWLPDGLKPLDVLFGIVVCGCVMLLPVYLVETLAYKPVPFTPMTATGVVVMGLFGSLIGNLMWNLGNQALGPNRASIFINLIPVFGILMAVPLLGEQLRPYHLTGFVVISAGVWCVLARRGAFTRE
ncbi:MAG: DMT family transporter [Gammaproteobacteria bacterium]|nr:DMT family transporter [Gammaproteobacteria bacterium]